MRTLSVFRRHLLSTAALVGALSSPSIASAYDAARAAASSDPENAAAYSVATEPSRRVVRPSLESAAARAAAASDPQSVAAYADVEVAAPRGRAGATTPAGRSAMASDPENVASHSQCC